MPRKGSPSALASISLPAQKMYARSMMFLELAHVSGGRRRTEAARERRGAIPLDLLPSLAVQLLHEIAGEEGYVLDPLPQRRHLDAHDVEAIVEVLAEFRPPSSGLLEVPVGRRRMILAN